MNPSRFAVARRDEGSSQIARSNLRLAGWRANGNNGNGWQRMPMDKSQEATRDGCQSGKAGRKAERKDMRLGPTSVVELYGVWC